MLKNITPLKIVISILASTIAQSSYAFPEIPFCPAGGPPGWVNYFNYQRDKNNWENYWRNISHQQRQTQYQRSPFKKYNAFQHSAPLYSPGHYRQPLPNAPYPSNRDYRFNNNTH